MDFYQLTIFDELKKVEEAQEEKETLEKEEHND